MANKLKDMLDPKNSGLALTLNFKSLEDRTNFINAIDKIGKTGVPQEVPVPKSIDFFKTVGGYQYPYDNVEDIVKMIVYPETDTVEMPIVVDGVELKYAFQRVRTDEVILLKSKNPKVLDVGLEFKIRDNKVNFNYKSHPGNATTIDELILEYKRFLALLDVLFQKPVLIEQLGDIKKYFNKSLQEYVRAKELCEVLGINITPKTVIDEDNKDFLTEKLYILLVKKSIIRQNDKLNFIEMADVDNLEIGQALFAVYGRTADLEIYGEHRKIYTVNCTFGAMIQDVKLKEDGINVVYFKDSEKNPMYRSYTAYLDEKDALDEMNNIVEKREQYENAAGWLDQLRELLQV